MSTSFSFHKQHVFVAGGTSGINLGIALAFARAGAQVAVMSRSADKVQQAVAQLQALGAQALGAQALGIRCRRRAGRAGTSARTVRAD